MVIVTAGRAEHANDLWPAFLLFKQTLYKMVLARPRLPVRQDNHVLVVLDEYTRMLTSHDAQSSEHVVMEQSRSSKFSFVLACQNLSGLGHVGGHVVVDKIMALASNFCFLANTCPATGRLAQRVCGCRLHSSGRENRTWARSDTEPCGTPQIQPYLKEAFPDLFGAGSFAIRTVEPVRTFWEKAMLLHEETFRKSSGGPKVRLARHYYDLWCLMKKGVGEKAKHEAELFKRIAVHRAVFFRKSKEAQESLRPGALRLIPLPEQLPAWKQDYQSMSEAMFFGEVPAFDEIFRVVGDFEKRFNKTD